MTTEITTIAEQSLSPEVTGLIGALIGGGCTLIASLLTFWYQGKQAEKAEDLLVQGVLQAIHDEMSALIERYNKAIGVQVAELKEGEAFRFFFTVSHDYFSAFHGNSFLIGRVKNHKLRSQIVRAYVQAKGTLDSYRMNNELLSKYEFAHKIWQETASETHLMQAKAHEESLIIYAAQIKQDHELLMRDVDELLNTLKEEGLLSEK
ncbi:hypothetical protein [Vibrio sp. SCSIO 43137]|uniref:hypothetical protein n=1 Tax=Vibrio sp. SCSIO 43137 TaxID=3021011 RepID=UPI002307F8E3|nr:hypothetical protein [Vibrio sp. SCSIO 43137]WCE28786.1 hypothetical protein PK654_10485 [Vibrio sp. SCSIO 43137]